MSRPVLSLAAIAAVALVAVPGEAAPPKPKPPIKGSYTATAPTPDPTSTDPVGGGVCQPTIPTAQHKFAFKAPAAGTLKVSLVNQLDWSVAIRNSKGQTIGSADGGSPTDVEVATVKLKKAEQLSIDTCNFLGEPTITVNYVFTFAPPVKK